MVEYFSNYLRTRSASKILEQLAVNGKVKHISNEDIFTLVKDWKGIRPNVMNIHGIIYNEPYVRAVFWALKNQGYEIAGLTSGNIDKDRYVFVEDGTGIRNRIYYFKPHTYLQTPKKRILKKWK